LVDYKNILGQHQEQQKMKNNKKMRMPTKELQNNNKQ
jgi:hypothetical protein